MDSWKLDDSNNHCNTSNDSTFTEAEAREEHAKVKVSRPGKRYRLKTRNFRLNRIMSIYSFGRLVKSAYDPSKEPRKKSTGKFSIEADGKQGTSTAAIRQPTVFRGETRHFELLRHNSLPCGTRGCLDIITDRPMITSNESVRSQAQPRRLEGKLRRPTTQKARQSKPSPILYMAVQAQRQSVHNSSSRPMSAPFKSRLTSKSKASPPFRCGSTRLRNSTDSIQTRKSFRTSVIRALKTPSTKFPIYPSWIDLPSNGPLCADERAKEKLKR